MDGPTSVRTEFSHEGETPTKAFVSRDLLLLRGKDCCRRSQRWASEACLVLLFIEALPVGGEQSLEWKWYDVEALYTQGHSGLRSRRGGPQQGDGWAVSDGWLHPAREEAPPDFLQWWVYPWTRALSIPPLASEELGIKRCHPHSMRATL